MTTRIITDSNGRKHITNEPLLHQPAPVQEPVAWMYEDMMGVVGVRVQKEKPIVARPVTPLCLCTPPAAQRLWVGLTDEEVYPLANEHLHYQMEGYEVSGIYNLAQAIETKLKEKNT